MEVWKPIPGYKEIYEVSDQGQVRSIDHFDKLGRHRKGRVLKQHFLSKGYKKVSLCGITETVHKLVALVFLGPRPDGLQVCHIDENKTNNKLSNLKYGTPRQNIKAHYEEGTGNIKAVVCSNGERYPSVAHAQRVTGINNISKVCRGVQKSAGGLTWRFAE